MKKISRRMRTITALALALTFGFSNVPYVYAADDVTVQEDAAEGQAAEGTVGNEETAEGTEVPQGAGLAEEQPVNDEATIPDTSSENAADAVSAEAAMAPQEALAAEPRTEGFINYGAWIGADNGDGTFTLAGCRSVDEYVDGTLEIPSTVEGMKVTSIKGSETSGGKFIIFSPEIVETIIFPDTVSFITNYGWNAVFEEFTNLKTVYLPNNPGAIIDGSQFPIFEGDITPIEHIYMGQMSDVSDLFGPWDLARGIKTLTVYDGVTEFDVDVRNGLPDLETINLPESIERFGFNDAPKLKTLNCPKPLNSIHYTHLDGCEELQVEITITSEWDYLSYDFQDSGITKVTIKGDALKSGLNKSAFVGCKYLREFYVEPGSEFHSEDGVLWWNDDIFAYPAAKSHTGNYDVPANVECIYYHAFDDVKFTSITFPEIMNPKFYWDRPLIPNEPTMFENNNMKVRVVPQSAAANDWFEGEEADFAAYQNIDPSRVEFYKGSTYKINYNLDGGTNAPGNPTSYRAGDNIVTLKAPTKEGYEFVRWDRNDGDDSGTTIIWDGAFQDFTFTAVWKKAGSTEEPDKPKTDFTDVPAGIWYEDTVKFVNDRKLMTGLKDDVFGPNESLARAQFAVILYRLEGSPSVEYSGKFHDVAAGQWFTDAILWASQEGIVTGYTNGNFGVGDPINREQMALMMYRYAKYKGFDVSKTADFSKFTDAKSVSDFAEEGMSWAVGMEIITGTNNGTKIEPQGSAVRAQCATIIQRFVTKYGM